MFFIIIIIITIIFYFYHPSNLTRFDRIADFIFFFHLRTRIFTRDFGAKGYHRGRFPGEKLIFSTTGWACPTAKNSAGGMIFRSFDMSVIRLVRRISNNIPFEGVFFPGLLCSQINTLRIAERSETREKNISVA